jgi:hypothetical protein
VRQPPRGREEHSRYGSVQESTLALSGHIQPRVAGPCCRVVLGRLRRRRRQRRTHRNRCSRRPVVDGFGDETFACEGRYRPRSNATLDADLKGTAVRAAPRLMGIEAASLRAMNVRGATPVLPVMLGCVLWVQHCAVGRRSVRWFSTPVQRGVVAERLRSAER